MNKYIRALTLLLFFIFFVSARAGEHPCLFISADEARMIKMSLGSYPLMDASYQSAKETVDQALSQPIDVPPPGEAGGYEHERHKQNYREMQMAGILFVITGEEKYAAFVKDMLFRYAEIYPELGAHPLSHNQAPGKLFHQMLNETVWLVYTSQAYDCIYNWLRPEDRDYIERNIFDHIITWFTEERAEEFDRIHNHGTWSVASIGMLGYVLDRPELVEMALYGTKKDGEGGFLKQLDMLFSPDGYYMEGPYYIRYALRPFFLFAEALERNQPDRKIYEYRDRILKKAYYSAVMTTFPNGVFPPINDASRTMNVEADGVVIANDLCFYRYGADPKLLGVASLQKQVVLNAAGLDVARRFGDGSSISLPAWGSIEFSDGHDGNQGGLGILRYGSGSDQTMLLMKYGVHGEGHGHFDKLHFSFFDQGREVVPDYGFARWINIEPKFGGRYLPENKSYAMQTVAHNTVTVDQKSQNLAERKEADQVSGLRHFFDCSNPGVQVMSAWANDHYPGVKMQRTLFLIRDQKVEYPVIVDLYYLSSQDEHEYDYILHYRGQMITTNISFIRNDSLQFPLGTDFGYEHIWQEARAETDESVQFTWLDGGRYYTITSAPHPQTDVFFGRTGAHDPNLNLISEPMIILRNSAESMVFASVIEPHGYFNEAAEQSSDARSRITSVSIVGQNQDGSIVEVTGKNDLKWRLMVTHGEASDKAKHSVSSGTGMFKWTGNYNVDLSAE